MAKKETEAQRADRQYREGVNMDVENVATRAKIMTGKDPKKMSNAQIQKANREYDYQDIREQKGSSAGSYVKPKKG